MPTDEKKAVTETTDKAEAKSDAKETAELDKARAALAKAQEEEAAAQAKTNEATAKVEEKKAALAAAQPPKTYLVYDRETVLEAEVLKDNEDGTKNLRVSGVVAQKFVTGASSPPSAREFLNVRQGGGRFDVGTYFIA